MSVPSPPLDVETAAGRIRACLAPGGACGVGIELELLVRAADGGRVPSADEVRAAADTGPLPHGGAVSVEPGGQLELSSPHDQDLMRALDVVVGDAAELGRRCADAGFRLHAAGLHPDRIAPLTMQSSRYRAITSVFAAAGPRSMQMATSSAGLQVNVDLGGDPVRRFRLASAIGPVLLALFANSPVADGVATGWASTRQLFWLTVPGQRARPAPTWSVDAWVDHVLDMPVLMIQRGDEATPVHDPLTFRRWVEDGHPSGPANADDLELHLTTIYPPVRPRGWLELRMLDSIGLDGVRVAATMSQALLCDDDAGRAGLGAVRGVTGQWDDAARHGCGHPGLARAASRCLRIAAETVDDADLSARCIDWAERYPDRGRSPADDRLDERGLSRP